MKLAGTCSFIHQDLSAAPAAGFRAPRSKVYQRMKPTAAESFQQHEGAHLPCLVTRFVYRYIIAVIRAEREHFVTG
jgi:hypothetical protein